MGPMSDKRGKDRTTTKPKRGGKKDMRLKANRKKSRRRKKR
jgi:hypothetical protein